MIDERIKAFNVPWCDEAAEILTAAVEHCHIADLKLQVENGASLFKLTQGDLLIGYYVLRVDTLAEHSEAVLVAGAGKHPEIDLTAAIIPVIEKQFTGCKYIRIHTARAGLVKKLTALGYQPQEFVLRKAL